MRNEYIDFFFFQYREHPENISCRRPGLLLRTNESAQAFAALQENATSIEAARFISTGYDPFLNNKLTILCKPPKSISRNHMQDSKFSVCILSIW